MEDDERTLLLGTIREELRSIERKVKRVRTLAAQLDTSLETDTTEEVDTDGSKHRTAA